MYLHIIVRISTVGCAFEKNRRLFTPAGGLGVWMSSGGLHFQIVSKVFEGKHSISQETPGQM